MAYIFEETCGLNVHCVMFEFSPDFGKEKYTKKKKNQSPTIRKNQKELCM